MKRLTPVLVLWLAVVAPPGVAAQSPPRVPTIGVLLSHSMDHPEARASFEVFRQALKELGYVEGVSIAIEFRHAEGKLERFPALAAELVRRKVDLIVAFTTPAARAARQATSTIPIVATAMQDPVRDGLVASLSRPGGNVTGLTFLGAELVPKRFALLKEAMPGISRVAGLWHPGGTAERAGQEMLKEAEAAARGLGVQLRLVKVEAPQDLEGAFAAMSRWPADAFVQLPSPMFYGERKRLVDLAARHRLPAMYNAREFVDLGGLMTYGASLFDLRRRGAIYVDRILKGANPADLPVEQPTRYELVINVRTARALGLTIPQSVLLRADEVVK